MGGGESVPAFLAPSPSHFSPYSRRYAAPQLPTERLPQVLKLARLCHYLILGCSLIMHAFFLRCFLVFNINHITVIELKRTRLIYHFESSLRTQRQVMSTRLHLVLYLRCLQVISRTSEFNISQHVFLISPSQSIKHAAGLRSSPEGTSCIVSIFMLSSFSLSFTFPPQLLLFDHS